MSRDVVDDPQHAEDLIGRLTAALEAVRPGLLVGPTEEAIAEAIAAAQAGREYCRPTCGWTDDGSCGTGEPDVCGCPCNHGEEEQE